MSSGATMPILAPISMDRLQMVIRPSTDMDRIAWPAYSTAWPSPLAAPSRPMTWRIMSLADTQSGKAPSKVTRRRLGFRCISVWVTMAWTSSLLPMPMAKAPTPPWVQVWLSPQTSVAPGSVTPSSGPITCRMPKPRSPMA